MPPQEETDTLRPMDPRSLSERVKIGAPCPMKWSEMQGDDRVRHCGACKLNVFNSAALRTDEIEALLNEGERTCMRVYRRMDGTLVTGDCSRLWAERKAAASSLLTQGLSVFGFIVVILFIVSISIVTLFGDNLRKLFGSTTGALAGPVSPPATAPTTKKSMMDFNNY